LTGELPLLESELSGETNLKNWLFRCGNTTSQINSITANLFVRWLPPLMRVCYLVARQLIE